VTDANGLVFESENIDKLVTCLNKLTADREKLAILGDRSKKIIKNWNLVNIAQAIEEEVNKANG
jgi:UDP-N-acetylglucosamine:LPS N-acetylglucosamine transferase